MFKLTGRKNFNIMCHHMRFDNSAVKSVIPPNSFYLSIMREPGALFESTFEYLWDLVPAFKRVRQGESPERWLDQAEKFYGSTPRDTYWFFAKNPTVYDFGFDNTNESDAYIAQTIHEIEHRFDLILIADYFEESMVLLSNALCWKLDEVACLSLNARKDRKMDLEQMTRLRGKARRWNRADAALFDHFNATLWKKIEAFGLDRMRAKVNELKTINRNLTEICVDGGKAVDSSDISDPTMAYDFFKPPGVAIGAYNLKKGAESNSQCRELILPEKALSKLVFKRQFKL